MKKLFVKDIVYIAIFICILAVCSITSIPLSVPITLQTFAVFLCINILGGKKAFIAVLGYIIIGALGIPVFSGFNGGIGHLLSPTGGYIIGFLLTVIISGTLNKFTANKFICHISGLLGCYILGTVWFMITTGNHNLLSVILLCVAPFIIPDILKIWLSIYLAKRINKIKI